MKSVIDIDIKAPRTRLAELFAEPANNPKWMDDVRYEPLSGTPGQPGSKYRLVSTTGMPDFTATVVTCDLPERVGLVLDAPTVSVAITDTFVSLAPDETKLISEEVFRFKGPFNKLKGLFAGRAIRNAHRRHMEAFKRFAERATQ